MKKAEIVGVIFLLVLMFVSFLLLGMYIGEERSNEKYDRWAYENRGRTIIFVAPDMGEIGLQDAVDQTAHNSKHGGLVIAFPGEFLLTKAIQIKGSNIVIRDWNLDGKFIFDEPVVELRREK